MIHNVVLVLGVQQSESVTRINISTLFFFRFFLHMRYYRVLSRVPCAIYIAGQNTQTAHAAQYIKKSPNNPVKKWAENL